eukprot:53354-Karenia_brevis.AAC.1
MLVPFTIPGTTPADARRSQLIPARFSSGSRSSILAQSKFPLARSVLAPLQSRWFSLVHVASRRVRPVPARFPPAP